MLSRETILVTTKSPILAFKFSNPMVVIIIFLGRHLPRRYTNRNFHRINLSNEMNWSFEVNCFRKMKKNFYDELIENKYSSIIFVFLCWYCSWIWLQRSKISIILSSSVLDHAFLLRRLSKFCIVVTYSTTLECFFL